MVEKEKGVSIKCLRFDGGGEYFSNEFSEYLKEHGIQRKYSCSYSPQQNGVAERKNRHIAEIAHAMLNEKNFPNYFWAEAVATAIYIMNRTPTTTLHGMTPEEKFTGKKPDVSHLRVFGCIAYVHVPDEKRSKLDLKLRNVSSLDTPQNKMDIDVSALSLESYKWVEMLCLMRCLVGTHH
jgi:transposase InsO family protein